MTKSTNGHKHILLGASNGKAIHFLETDIREIGRTATGVRGMDIPDDEEIVGFAVVDGIEDDILVITENGYGKRTSITEYRLQNRGGKGVKTLNVTDKNGKLKTLRKVTNDEDIIVVSDRGITIRMPIDQISQTKRATQGVRIITLKGDQKVSTIAIVDHQEPEEEVVSNEAVVTQEQMALSNQKKVLEVVELEALEESVEEEDTKNAKQTKLDL